MPLGLWKSNWEIHREAMDRCREQTREEQARSDARWLELRDRSDARWLELREECRDLREDYEGEIAETRAFNREMLIRIEKSHEQVGAALGLMAKHMQLMSDEIIAMRGEIHELKAAVEAQTEAILKLVDRFEEWDGRPPV